MYLGALRERVVYRFRQKHPPWLKLLPPEAGRLAANRDTIRAIRRQGYEGVISFDVPPTIGLCLLGVKNIILLIRKDLLGYEKTIHPQRTLRNRIRRAFLWLCEDICLRRAKGIIVQCVYDKRMLISRHPELQNIEEKIRVQINNVDPAWIREKAEVKPAVPSDKDSTVFRICFIGNFNDRRKGHEVFLPVAKEITQSYDHVYVDVIGAGKELEKYRALYETDRICFYGHVENPFGILKSCDLSVVPSFADSCPNTVMEALYCNVAVVGSDRGGIPEILSNNSLELFELNHDSLKAKILCLLEDKTAYKALCEDEADLKKNLMFDWASCIHDVILSLLEEGI